MTFGSNFGCIDSAASLLLLVYNQSFLTVHFQLGSAHCAASPLIRGFIIHGKLGAQLCTYVIPEPRKSSFCFLGVNLFYSLVITLHQRSLVRASVDHDPALASVLSVALTTAAIAAR